MGPQTLRGSKDRHTDAQQAFGGVQTVAVWARKTGMVPEDLPWADPFSKMRLKEAGSDRDASEPLCPQVINDCP